MYLGTRLGLRLGACTTSESIALLYFERYVHIYVLELSHVFPSVLCFYIFPILFIHMHFRIWFHHKFRYKNFLVPLYFATITNINDFVIKILFILNFQFAVFSSLLLLSYNDVAVVLTILKKFIYIFIFKWLSKNRWHEYFLFLWKELK